MNADRAAVEAAVEAATQFRDAWHAGDVRTGSGATFLTLAEDGTTASLTEPQLTTVLAELKRLGRVEQERDGAEPVKYGPTGTGVPATMHLEAFGQTVKQAFGHVPYHVGTSAVSKTGWRDVDLRLMLPDDEFDALFPGYSTAHHIDAFWSLICAAISELGRVRTGLPVDFQIQRTSDANEKYPGFRAPLMLITADGEQHPRRLPNADLAARDEMGAPGRVRDEQDGAAEAVWLTQDDEGNFGVWRDPDVARREIVRGWAAETPGVYEWVNDPDRTHEVLLRDDEPTGMTLWMALVADADLAARDEREATCPTPCDDDCDADCHETHDVPAKRQHQPEDCPSRKAGQ